MVVAGGGALLPGLCARLATEIEALTAAATGAVADADADLNGSGGYAWARACVTGHHQPEEPDSSTSGGDRGGSSRARTTATTVGEAGGRERQEGSGSGRGLCVVRVPVRRDLLVWTGASIMASLGGIAQRCLTSEQYLARAAGGAVEDGEGGGRLPDWMSVSPADWVFEAPAPVATA